MARATATGKATGTNVIQSQSGCRLLCILSRSTCMLPDASQDPTIRHILNDVASSSSSSWARPLVSVPARPKLLYLSLGRPVALIEKFASHIKTERKKGREMGKEFLWASELRW